MAGSEGPAWTKEAAMEVLEDCATANAALNAIALRCERQLSGDDRAEVRRAFAEIIGAIYGDLMRPVLNRYPDLAPDRLKDGQEN